MNTPVAAAFVRALAAALSLATVLPATAAAADPVEDFYRGKTITVVVSLGVGGNFDLTARTLAKHMPRHLPGRPAMVVKNMPGGGHVLATNHMANQAARDGTVIALVNNSVALHQVLDGRGARYDARSFNWLGSAGLSNLMTVAWHTSGVRTIEDAMTRELVTGATGVGSGGFIYPNAMNVLLGTKFKIVLGYATTPQADLAMERGEIAARAGFSLSSIMQEHADWIREKKVALLVQVGATAEPGFPQVPLMHDLAKTPQTRRILALISSPVALGRPFFTTADVPVDRVAALRRAFDATMRDEAFLAEARQLNLDLRPTGADAITAIVRETIDAPADLIAVAKSAMEAPPAPPERGKTE